MPDFLELTPERLKENEARQKSWRESAGSSFSAQGAQRTRAVLIERDARHVLAVLQEQFKTAADVDDMNMIIAAANRERSRLADALATQGRYDEAAKTEPNKRRSAEYTKIWEAVWLDDEATCKCPEYRKTPKGQELPNDTHALDVFSLKHGQDMALVKCGICGFCNVRNLTTRLIDQQRQQKWRLNQ